MGLVGVLLVLAGCSQSSVSSLPAGWTWYHDTRFPFQLPIPPGWHAGAFSDGPLNDETCGWVVGILPGYLPGPPDKGALEYAPEEISVIVNISCPEWQPSDDPHFVPEAHSITISGATATLYDNDIPGYGVERVAVMRFGGHQYRVFMGADPSRRPVSDATVQRDLAFYKHVLRSFTYHGT
jgi:hypothetical protein